LFQDASFYFANVAPQWQCFNGGNWAYLENGVRTFVAAYGADLDVYTGTHGVLELDDVDGNKVEIWLYPEGAALPVPK
jgi:DNA/RNA endonuclease G (NUC1)